MATPKSLTVPVDVAELVYAALVYTLPHLPPTVKANMTKVAQQYDRDRKQAMFAAAKIPPQAVDIYSRQAAQKLRSFLQNQVAETNDTDFKMWTEELATGDDQA